MAAIEGQERSPVPKGFLNVRRIEGMDQETGMMEKQQTKHIAGYRVQGPPGHVSLEVGPDEAARAVSYAEAYGQPLQVVYTDDTVSVYVRQD